MKKLKTLLFSESGMAMPLVITIVTAAVSSIAYIIITLLPQLQDEKKKAQDSINYKIFITSLNDYVIHGIREKWCVNNISYSGGVLETDLLLSNDCSSTATMEQIVTFPGNLERILWDDDTIGPNNSPAGSNTIIGLNKQKIIDAPGTPAITNEQVKINELKLHLSENVLLNMTNEHPLYIITRNIRNCVQSVDITIKRDSTFVTGEDKQLSVKIVGNINNTKLSCLSSIQDLSSEAYYTFYPRRLHTYSLIKYGDLKTDMFHEYHGPVYVGGDLILPNDSYEKSKSSIFYNTLTLGVYNEGVAGGEYRAGKVKTNTGADYTFEERGHPYLSKQDNYPNFRGIIGGLRLDASEDKGLFNLFASGGASASDVASLEECIEENQVKTKPSYTAGSLLAYKDTVTSGAGLNIRVGLTDKNRFKPNISAPVEMQALPESPTKKFVVAVTSTSGTKEIGDFKIIINPENTYRFSTAPGSPAELIIDYEKYDLKPATLDAAITILNGTITVSNYQTLFPSGHTLTNPSNLALYGTYLDKVNDFKALCDANATDLCTDFGITATCVAPATCPDYTSQKTAMTVAQNNLKTKISQIKTIITSDLARATFAISDFNHTNGKKIINQKDISISFSSAWPEVIPLIKSSLPENEMFIEFTAYQYSSDVKKIIFSHNLANPTAAMKIKRQDNGNTVSFPTASGWSKATNTNSLPSSQTPEPITELDCPDGMTLADWNQDMSGNTNFSWNYANTPSGAIIDEATHDNLDDVNFYEPSPASLIPPDGHATSHSKSVVTDCTVTNNRRFVFGFYVCENLTINPGRSAPLYMIGTFIVKNIINLNTDVPVYWHSVWDAKAGALIISEFKRGTPACTGLIGKTWADIISNPALKEKVKSCSAMDLVNNGPNNFTWTTVDPDIGLIAGNTMTSQKVLRIQKWIIREDSRSDIIR